MIMLRRPIDRETREILFGNFCHELGGNFPDRFFLGRRGGHRRGLFARSTIARMLDPFCVHVSLQVVQRFRKQGIDRLASLLGERSQKTSWCGCQIQRVRFHRLTIATVLNIRQGLIHLAI